MGNCCTKRSNLNIVHLPHIDKIKIRKISFENRPINYQRGSVYQVNNEDIYSVYDFETQIGTGYYGTVKIASPKNDPNKKYAVKSIDKRKLNEKKIQNLSREIEVLASVDHPNIIKYHEIYNDEFYFHIVMEYCSGGELFERIIQKKRYSEAEAANVIYKITSAINHCHSIGIVHRDLKPENILYENKSEFSDLKIIDFGLSRMVSSDELHSVVGSPYYVSPEVLHGTYDSKCDVWGVGVLMYVLLVGKPPFYSDNKPELFNKIKTAPVPLESPVFETVSVLALDLIRSLLQKNPKKRPTASKILDHLWFKKMMEDSYSISNLDPSILKNLQSFQQPRQLTKRILKFIVKELKSAEIENLKRAFTILDRQKTGYIDINQLQKAFEYLNIEVKDEELTKIFHNCGLNQRIDYSSFIAAAMDKKDLLNKDLLRHIFKRLDMDQSGFISIEDFQKAINRTGKTKHLEEVRDMFREAGYENNAEIDFYNFCVLLEKDL